MKRCHKLLSLLAAVVAKAVAAIATESSLPDLLPSVTQPNLNNIDYTTDGRNGRLNFIVPSPDDDESFRFSIEAMRTSDSVTCGTLELQLNGETLEQTWTRNRFGHGSSLQGRVIVPVESTANQLNHSLSLQTSSFCVEQNADADHPTTVEVTSFQIVTIDGRHITELLPGFTASFVVSRNDLHSDLTLTNSSLLVPTRISVDIPETSEPTDKSIEDEIVRLNLLENEFKGVKHLYEGQKQLVSDLSQAEFYSAKGELEKCETLGCVVKTLYAKTKGCLLLMYLRYGAGSSSEDLLSSNTTECVHADSPSMRANILMSGQKLCSTASSEEKALNATNSDTMSNAFYVGISTSTMNHQQRAIHITLDVLVVILCLSCLVSVMHYRCLNPRKAAERAARREERLAQKEYRRAARRHAIRSWLRHFLGKDASLRQDYEEKRAMILSQEAILEGAMQGEINRLRNEANPANAAEEGRSDTSSIRRGRTASRPPSYRTRASSGQPPSYISQDERRPRRNIFDGFRGYIPGANLSGTTLGGDPEMHENRSVELDATPDTSVFSLSPRPSFETLRTEKSVV